MNIEQAAYFVFKYGNVGRNWEELITTSPTQKQLREAELMCHAHASNAIKAMREYHSLPEPPK